MRARIGCADAYEAQKLAGLVFARDSGETSVSAILNVVGREVVIGIRDGSAHSVLLRDEGSVEALADFCQSVFDGEHVLVSAEASGDAVSMSKAQRTRST